MTLDPRTPVVVGAGQVMQKPADLEDAMEAVALMEEAARRAAADAGVPDLLAEAGLIAVAKGAWRYPDPARLLADRFGAKGAITALTTDGGNTPQSVVNKLARRIASGDLEVGVLVGAETIYTRRRMRAKGLDRPLTEQGPAVPDETLGNDLQMSSDLERARGFEMPINFYPTFECALRASQGESHEAHLARISTLWARFNEIAVANPYAWFRTPMTADEIATPSADNRMVGFPYTKAMNSNWDLDQGAALIVTSLAAAEAAGVARDLMVFLHAGTDAHDTPLVSHRDRLDRSPAIRAAGQRVLELAGIGPDDLAHVDLYSCFPSAVQVSAREIGLGLDRDLTVTGGLTFAGGPLNNYVTHSIATMVGRLRSDAGAFGLVTANGGYLTKHALGIYSTTPPATGFRWEDCQAAAEQTPARELAPADYEGPATIEAYTVMHGHAGPERGLVAVLTPGGARAWGNTEDQTLMAALMTEELVGRDAHLEATGTVSVA